MSEKNPFSHFADALRKAVGAKPAVEASIPAAISIPRRERTESPGRMSPSHPEKFVDEWKTAGGKRYRKYDSGYTVAEYYNHPGPGWDFRWPVMEKYGVWDPMELPDDTLYRWYDEETGAEPEYVLTIAEVRNDLRELVEGIGKETDERSDADGLWLLEIQVEGPKPGEMTEYSYRRAGTYGNNKHAVTTIEAAYFEDGIPVGRRTIANLVDGEWIRQG